MDDEEMTEVDLHELDYAREELEELEPFDFDYDDTSIDW